MRYERFVVDYISSCFARMHVWFVRLSFHMLAIPLTMRPLEKLGNNISFCSLLRHVEETKQWEGLLHSCALKSCSSSQTRTCCRPFHAVRRESERASGNVSRQRTRHFILFQFHFASCVEVEADVIPLAHLLSIVSFVRIGSQYDSSLCVRMYCMQRVSKFVIARLSPCTLLFILLYEE
jgi:hypothetical protein